MSNDTLKTSYKQYAGNTFSYAPIFVTQKTVVMSVRRFD